MAGWACKVVDCCLSIVWLHLWVQMVPKSWNNFIMDYRKKSEKIRLWAPQNQTKWDYDRLQSIQLTVSRASWQVSSLSTKNLWIPGMMEIQNESTNSSIPYHKPEHFSIASNNIVISHLCLSHPATQTQPTVVSVESDQVFWDSLVAQKASGSKLRKLTVTNRSPCRHRPFLGWGKLINIIIVTVCNRFLVSPRNGLLHAFATLALPNTCWTGWTSNASKDQEVFWRCPYPRTRL